MDFQVVSALNRKLQVGIIYQIMQNLLIKIYCKSQQMMNINPKNIRGDKNVINGAKKTLISVIKALSDSSSKLASIKEVLRQNNINSNAETITWMYIGLLKNSKISEVVDTMKQYRQRMKAKIGKAQTHENIEYVQKKRKRIQKYVQSASYLTQAPSKNNILQSVEVLFQYQSCSRRALQKMQKYFEQNYGYFEEIFQTASQYKGEQPQNMSQALPKADQDFRQNKKQSDEQLSEQIKTQEPKNERQIKRIIHQQDQLYFDPFDRENQKFQVCIQEDISLDSWDNYFDLSDRK